MVLHSVASSTDRVDFDQKRIDISQSHENILSIDVCAIFTGECSLEEEESDGFIRRFDSSFYLVDWNGIGGVGIRFESLVLWNFMNDVNVVSS